MRARSVVLGFVASALGALAVLACEDASSSAPQAIAAGDASSLDAGTAPNDAAHDAANGAQSLCVDGAPGPYPTSTPDDPYGTALLGVLSPDLAFEGPDGTVRPKDAFEPCAARSRLLVFRTTAPWCGTCDWHARHTRELIDDPSFEGRLSLVDLVVSDEDNMPPSSASADGFRARVTAPAHYRVALDPGYSFLDANIGFNPLPLYVFVDSRTMVVKTAISNPSPEMFYNQVAITLAELDGAPRPAWVARPLFDDRFSADQWDMIGAMKLDGAPPADPTNEYADVPAAAAFGKTLFEDASLSPSGAVSCATCHMADKDFADGLPQGHGESTGDRNTPSLTLASHARWQFWDGRADTLWMQALGPFENDKEFASSRLFVSQRVASKYKSEYEAIFGAKYPLPDMSKLPPSGKPGEPSWQSLDTDQRRAVNRIFSNVGKAIAAFERTLRSPQTPLDAYANRALTALSDEQKESLATFFETGCAQCHWGPRLTDDAFHALRFPTGHHDGLADRGRVDAFALLAASEFTASKEFSDAKLSAKPVATVAPGSMLGAFKTPSLRGVASTAPYGHGGTFATLNEVTQHYGERGMKVASTAATGAVEAWVPSFDTTAQGRLVPILQVLTSP